MATQYGDESAVLTHRTKKRGRVYVGRLDPEDKSAYKEEAAKGNLPVYGGVVGLPEGKITATTKGGPTSSGIKALGKAGRTFAFRFPKRRAPRQIETRGPKQVQLMSKLVKSGRGIKSASSLDTTKFSIKDVREGTRYLPKGPGKASLSTMPFIRRPRRRSEARLRSLAGSNRGGAIL